MTARIRPLSPIERTVWRLSAGSSLNFTTIARLRGEIGESAIQRGIDAAQARHPHLREAIDGSDPAEPWFVSSGGRRIELEVADDEWIAVVERELRVPIDEDGPLARVIWVPFDGGGRLMLTLHHAIGDGKSGAFALRDILAAATAEPGSCLESLPSVAPIDQRLAPNAQGFRGRAGLFRFAATETWRDWTLGKASSPRFDQTPRCTERTTMVLAREFDPDWVSRVARRARAERTSVHGVLLAAIAMAIVDDHDKDAIVVNVGSPIDLRDTLHPPAGEDVGYFVSLLPFRRRLSGREDIWQIAREIKAELVAGKAAGRDHVTAHALPLVASILRGHTKSPTEFVHAWEDTVQSTAGLTNLGRLNIQTDYGSVVAEAVHFAVNTSALSAFVSTATSTSGRLNWNFQFTQPTFTREHAEALTDRMVARVEEAAEIGDD